MLLFSEYFISLLFKIEQNSFPRQLFTQIPQNFVGSNLSPDL